MAQHNRYRARGLAHSTGMQPSRKNFVCTLKVLTGAPKDVPLEGLNVEVIPSAWEFSKDIGKFPTVSPSPIKLNSP